MKSNLRGGSAVSTRRSSAQVEILEPAGDLEQTQAGPHRLDALAAAPAAPSFGSTSHNSGAMAAIFSGRERESDSRRYGRMTAARLALGTPQRALMANDTAVPSPGDDAASPSPDRKTGARRVDPGLGVFRSLQSNVKGMDVEADCLLQRHVGQEALARRCVAFNSGHGAVEHGSRRSLG